MLILQPPKVLELRAGAAGQPAQAVSIGEYKCIIKIESLRVKSMDEGAHFRVASSRKALTVLRLSAFRSAPVIRPSARRFELRRGLGRRAATSRRGLPEGFAEGLVEAEEALDSEEEAVGRVLFADGRGGVGGQSRTALVDRVAECFDEVRVGIEESFHRVVAYLKHLGLLGGDDVGRARLAREERHLAEELALAQALNRARRAVGVNAHVNAAAVDDEHRGAAVAGAYDGLAGREDVPTHVEGQRVQLVRRERREDVHVGQKLGKGLSSAPFAVLPGGLLHVDRAHGEAEVETVAAEGVPDALAHERVGVVVARVVREPVLDLPLDDAVAEVAYAHDRRHVAQDVVALAYGLADGVYDLDGRVCVDGAEVDDARVLAVARADLDGLLGDAAVADKDDVVRESFYLDGAPGDAHHDARPLADG